MTTGAADFKSGISKALFDIIEVAAAVRPRPYIDQAYVVYGLPAQCDRSIRPDADSGSQRL
jgi:hypothetical protein